MVSTFAITDALAKLLIEEGVITDTEFSQKLLEERAVYQHILNPTRSNYQPHSNVSAKLKYKETLSL